MVCLQNSKTLCGINTCNICYLRSFATHSKSNYWSLKNTLQPIQVLKNSNKKYWFYCTSCNHDIEIKPNNIIKGQWCTYCNGNGLCYLDNCTFCYNRSFASHPMSIKWSDKNENSPRYILKKSDKKYIFKCDKCNHEFQSSLYSLNSLNHCPYCTNQKMCINTCENCFKKSCASHLMNSSWSSKNELKSINVFINSNKKIIFNCLVCNHEYVTTPNHYNNRNGSCPYCANKYLCNKDDCLLCYNKSFASHSLNSCWSNKNNISSRNVFKGSENKYIFNCNICNHDFESKMYNVLTGYWCPYCKNKTEGIIFNFIKSINLNCKTQMRFEWCRNIKTKNIMPYDFGLIDNKILIELDGEQHFSQISNWDTPDNIKEKDIQKINYSIDNNYSIIHIYQHEIWNNIYDWKSILKACIDKLINTTEIYAIFISYNTTKYDSHISKLNSYIKYEKINPII
jgi:hypothetical protein